MNSSNQKLKSGKWTLSEDNLLTQLIEEHGEKQWKLVASFMLTRTPIQCLHRWTKILKPGLVKGHWTPEEDKLLMEYVETFGSNNWSNVGKIIQGRSGKQCRERWLNNLSPNIIKGHWKKEEDEKIFIYFLQYGTQWCKIAKFLPGRTENSIKNRIYSTIRKIKNDHMKKFIKSQQNQTICSYSQSQNSEIDFEHKNEKEFINSLILQKLQKLQQIREHNSHQAQNNSQNGEQEIETVKKEQSNNFTDENFQPLINQDKTEGELKNIINSIKINESEKQFNQIINQTQSTIQPGKSSIKLEQYGDLRSQILFIEQQIFSVKNQIEKIINIPSAINLQNQIQQIYQETQQNCLLSGDDLFEKYTAQPLNLDQEELSFDS